MYFQREREREGGGEGMGGEKGKGRSVDPDREEAYRFWLRFGRDSVYNTKAVCASDEIVNC